ncbi:MAG TPA: hypothetical protein VGF97_00905, partial [Rhizomicrobium sp.]
MDVDRQGLRAARIAMNVEHDGFRSGGRREAGRKNDSAAKARNGVPRVHRVNIGDSVKEWIDQKDTKSTKPDGACACVKTGRAACVVGASVDGRVRPTAVRLNLVDKVHGFDSSGFQAFGDVLDTEGIAAMPHNNSV